MDSCSSGVMVVCLQGCMIVVLGWLAWSAPAVQSMVAVENHTNLNLQQEAISIRADQQKIRFGCWITQRRFLASVRATGDCKNECSSTFRASSEGSTNQISIFIQNLLASCRSNFDALKSIFTRLGCNLLLLINNPQRICNYVAVGSFNLLSFSSPSPTPLSSGMIHPHHHTSVAATPSKGFIYGGLQTPAASISRKLLASSSSVDQTTARTDSLTLGPPDPPQPRDLPAIKKTSSTLHPPDAYHSSLPP